MIGAEGNVGLHINEFECSENKKTFTVILNDFGDTRLVKKDNMDSIRTNHYEDKVRVAPYFMWTLDPSGADELLTNKIIEQAKIRIEYAESIKHLWNK